MSPSTATLDVGGTLVVTAVVQDGGGQPVAGKPITWSSSSSSVATVTAGGTVTAIAVGTTRITATVDGRSGSATLTVINSAPALLRVLSDTVHALQLVLMQPTSAGAALPDTITGTFGQAPFRVIRAEDTLLVGIVPDLPTAGPQRVQLPIGGRLFAATVAVAARAPLANAATQAAAVFDQLVAQQAGLDAALDAGRIRGVDTAVARVTATRGRSVIDSVRRAFAALPSSAQPLAYGLLAAHLQSSGFTLGGPAAALRHATAVSAQCSAAIPFEACLDAAGAVQRLQFASQMLARCTESWNRRAVTSVAAGIRGDAPPQDELPRARLAWSTSETLWTFSYLVGTVTSGNSEVSEFFRGLLGSSLGDAIWCQPTLIAAMSDALTAITDVNVTDATAPFPLTVGVSAPVIVRAQLRSLSTSTTPSASAVAAPLSTLRAALVRWEAARTQMFPVYMSPQGPKLTLPSAPVIDLTRDVPGALLRVGAITPSVVTGAGSGSAPWFATFANPKQGDDLTGFSFGVQFAPAGFDPQSRVLSGVLRPARYYVAGLTISPTQDTLLVGKSRTYAYTARDSSGDVLSSALLLGRQPTLTSGGATVATVLPGTLTATALAPGTTTLNGVLEGGTATTTLIVNPDVTGVYSLRTLNGIAIPGLTYSDPLYTITTHSGTLSLGANGTFGFTVSADGRNRSGGPTYDEGARGSGTYTVSGSTITFFLVPKPGDNITQVASATLVGNRLTISYRGKDSDGADVAGVAMVER